MIGIALGVMALIVVLSVMNGFVSQVRDRMLSVVSHVEVFANNGALRLARNRALARRNPQVIGTAPYVTAQALLTNGERFVARWCAESIRPPSRRFRTLRRKCEERR